MNSILPNQPQSGSGTEANGATKHLRQCLLLEELMRKRRTGDTERYVEAFRRSTVDPNPHQVEAVAFALNRLERGGALLCDEVGLGKTIEAGLLLTQLRAEGRNNILIIVPLPLARQWQVELLDHFGLKSVVPDKEALRGELGTGIYIVGRERAGSPKWSPFLAKQTWDLVVIDEAHENIGSIHVRFSKHTGAYQDDLSKGKSKRAAYIKYVIGDSPVLLLTATPLQNNLYELWSLAHFVDRGDLALGRFHEYSRLFCTNKGRALKEGTEEELRQRVKSIACRTLRSDAQPFLRTPFTARHCETVNFNMASAERELYEAVSEWLERPMAAYKMQNRRMIILNLRKTMGSSVSALVATLRKVRGRLENPNEDDNDEELDWAKVEEDIQELQKMEELAHRALREKSPKLERLWDVIEKVGQGAMRGVASDKIVVFTQSVRTQRAIVSFLESRGLRGQVTTFSGQNKSHECQEALRVWQRDVGHYLDLSQRPEPSSAMRAALIHEFKTRTRVLVSTEAGAKGLNLQFCNCLVNFDLPWNPQRIEQRIGRVHRYGQVHDVVVVNFINRDNEGENRVYDLLRTKLQLFEGVFGASDPVLGQIASTLDFERRVSDLFFSCRTAQERGREFDRMELELDEQEMLLRDQHMERARSLISNLHDDVQARLRLTAEELPAAISRRDEAVLKLLETEDSVWRLDPDGDRVVFEWGDRRFHLGPPDPGERCGEPMDLTHPILSHIAEAAQRYTDGRLFRLSGSGGETWCVYRVLLRGLEEEERLLVLGPGGRDGLEAQLESDVKATPVEMEWPDPSEYDGALDDLCREVEGEQAPRVETALRQMAARRDDVRRFVQEEEEHLITLLADAERKHTNAKSPSEVSVARSVCQRHRNRLEDLRTRREDRLWEASQSLNEQERELHEKRYVESEVTRLFCVQREER